MKVKIKMHVRGGMPRGMHSGKQGETVENRGKQGKTGEKGALNGYEMAIKCILGVNLGPLPSRFPEDSQRIPRGAPPEI